jgi:hypothetical protein
MFDILAQTLHRCHGVRIGGVSLFEAMSMFVGLRKDVWVLCRRKDAIEVCFVKPFAGSQNLAGSIRRRE